ncbi:MAG: hypothetical protein R3B90_13840 [Planctomycetaceae bacterium]
MSPEIHLQGHTAESRDPAGPAASTVPWATHLLTVGLACLASTVVSIAVADGEYSAAWWVVRCSETAVVIVVSYWMRQWAANHKTLQALSPALVLLVLGNLLWEPCQRWCLDWGRPFELVVIDSLRLIALGLSAASARPEYGRLATCSSLFLVMFGAMLSFTPLVHVLVGVYAAGAIGWLAATYWDSLRSRLVVTGERRNPRWSVKVLIGLFGVAVLSVGATNESAAVALRGFLPSSGGNRGNDPYARSGVGDGDLLVAGSKNIQSFAPIEEAPFVDDHLPGLYDVINDVSGEPRKIPPRNGLRVAVPQELAAKLKQHLHTRTEKAAREFSTLRRAVPPRQQKIKDIASNALFYVAGRTPLHLRMQTYALFDGIDWIPESVPEPHRLPELRIVKLDGKPWLQLDDQQRWAPYLAEAETHAIKPVRLGSAEIPAPVHLHGIHIDMVEHPHFFEWGAGGVVRMKRDELPGGIAIHLASRTVDEQRISKTTQTGRFLKLEEEHGWVPSSARPDELRKLALEWAGGESSGWPQVRAIVERLRQDYVVDPTIKLGTDDRSAVTQFLFESRRGPDYQFATAARCCCVRWATRRDLSAASMPGRIDTMRTYGTRQSSRRTCTSGSRSTWLPGSG